MNKSHQKLDVILENKVVYKLKFSKNVNNKKCDPKIILFNEWKLERFGLTCLHRKLTLKVRILSFLTTFTQLTCNLKNFLRGWLLVLGLKEGLVKCATVCVKSGVMLMKLQQPKKDNMAFASKTLIKPLSCPYFKVPTQSRSQWIEIITGRVFLSLYWIQQVCKSAQV